MTEAEWQSGLLTLENMVDLCATAGSERKLRLFLHACCCRIEHGLFDPRSRAALDAMGRYLEGPPDPDKLVGLQSLAREAYNTVGQPFDVDDMDDPSAEAEAAHAVLCLTNPSLKTSWQVGEPSPWTW